MKGPADASPLRNQCLNKRLTRAASHVRRDRQLADCRRMHDPAYARLGGLSRS
jgi:hypothetical protein